MFLNNIFTLGLIYVVCVEHVKVIAVCYFWISEVWWFCL